MGLFSNNKKLCPICGGPTPRLFSTKIEDMPICKECDKKIDLPDGAAEQMSLDAFRAYIAFYEENQPLRSAFTESACYPFHFLRDAILVDGQHGLFRLNRRPTGLVFETASLKGFRVWQDQTLLMEGDPAALRLYETDVPDQIRSMQYDVDLFNRERMAYEREKRRQNELEQRARERGEKPPFFPFLPEPRFDVGVPVRQFRLELLMDHPYWPGYQEQWDGPAFDDLRPSILTVLNEYQKTLDELYDLACGLMTVLNPQAQEVRVPLGTEPEPEAAAPIVVQVTAPQPQAAPAQPDAVEAIKKYKELLDLGVITEEEFTAKKRQLLGI